MTASRGSLWVLGAALALLAVLVGAAAMAVIGFHERTRNQLDAIEPRYARMLGYLNERQSLRAGAAGASAAMGMHFYPADKDVSQAGNDAQQRVRDLLVRGGLDVSSIQLLPARSLDRFDRISVGVRTEGSLLALQTTLAALPMSAPTLFVDGLSLQGVGLADPTAPARVVAEIEFFVLRARP